MVILTSPHVYSIIVSEPNLAEFSKVIVPLLLVTASVTFRVLPLFTILLPEFTVSVLANAVVFVPSIIGLFVTLGIITSEAAVGTLPQDQFEG